MLRAGIGRIFRTAAGRVLGVMAVVAVVRNEVRGAEPRVDYILQGFSDMKSVNDLQCRFVRIGGMPERQPVSLHRNATGRNQVLSGIPKETQGRNAVRDGGEEHRSESGVS